MNVAKKIAESLRSIGVTTVFGIPGTDNTLLFLELGQSGIRTVVPRNEIFTPIMAEGYALTSHNYAVTVTIPGPGALATLPGILDAHKSGLSIFSIVVDVPSREQGKRRGYLHEVDGGLEPFFAPFSKATYVSKGNHASKAIQDYAAQFKSPQRGLHTIIVPTDVLESEILENEILTQTQRTVAPEKVSGTTDKLRVILETAKRPIFMVGRGVEHAEAVALLDRLARRVGAPMITSISGLGMMPDHAERFDFGQLHVEPEIRALIAQSDCVVMWGTRMSQRSWWGHLTGAPSLCLSVDHRADSHTHYPAYRISEDIYRVVTHLITHTTSQAHSRWVGRWRSVARRVQAQLANRHPVEMGILREFERVRKIRPITIWADSTKLAYWMRRYLQGHGTFRFPMGSGMIGWALSAGMGGILASRELMEDMEHMIIIGDGGLTFTLSELSTLAALQLPLTIFLVDNASYGIIADYHRSRYGCSTPATDLPRVNWVLLAHAFGIEYQSATTQEELALILRDRAKTPRLIDVRMTIGRPLVP
jgi:acetolactate synthase I/II/III large subunit